MLEKEIKEVKMKQAILSIIFRRDKGEIKYLLLKRTPSRGGFWQPVSGRVEENEIPLEAAKREVMEETGIKKFKKIISDVYTFSLENEPYKTSYCFGFEVSPKTKIDLNYNIYPEHNNIKWCGFNEAIRLLKWPHNKEALKRLKEIISKPLKRRED